MTSPPFRPTTNRDPDDPAPSDPTQAQRPPIPPPVQKNTPREPGEPVAPPVQVRTAPDPAITDKQTDGGEAQAEKVTQEPTSHRVRLTAICCLLAILAGGAVIAVYHVTTKTKEPVAVSEPTEDEPPKSEKIVPDAEHVPNVTPNTTIDDSAPDDEPADSTDEDVVADDEPPVPNIEEQETESEEPEITEQTPAEPEKPKKTEPKPSPKPADSADPKTNPLAYVKLVRDAHNRCKTLGWNTSKPEGFKALESLLQLASDVIALQQDKEIEEGLRLIAMGPVTDALADLNGRDWPADAEIARLNESSLDTEARQSKPVYAFTQVVRSTRGIPLVDGQPALLLEAIGSGELIVYPLQEHLLVKKGTRYLIFGVKQAEDVELDLTEYQMPQNALLVRGNHVFEKSGDQLANTLDSMDRKELTRPNNNARLRRNRK